MAQKPTIYKFNIDLSDLDREVYERLNLTVALHPSETVERMMVRVLAYCLNAQEFLTFGKGLSDADEPDIWMRSLDDQVGLWIDVGEPAHERVKKACNVSQAVKVYAFNSKADVWWLQGEGKFRKLKAEYFHLDWASIQVFAKLLERGMDFSMTVSGHSAYIAASKGECEVSWQSLNP